MHSNAAPSNRGADTEPQAFAMGMLQTPAARLGVLVHVIILNLAEIPVIGIHQFDEHI
jgi:hypothetical protein